MTTYERGAEADAEAGGEDFMSTCYVRFGEKTNFQQENRARNRDQATNQLPLDSSVHRPQVCLSTHRPRSNAALLSASTYPQLALRYTPPLASRASPRSRALCVREHAHQTSPWTSLTHARSRASSNHTQLYSYHVTWPPLPCARAPAPSNPYRQLPPALYSYLTLAAILIPYAR